VSVLGSTRRGFLKTAAPVVVPSAVLGQRSGAVAPSDRIVLGAIGIGSRGAAVLKAFLGNQEVQFRAICDVREERREAIKSLADQFYGNQDCAMYGDQYELLAREDIDAVLIATGDRWHALLSIIAAQHGKDVYCEKPCSMTIAESQALADTFRRYGRLYQAGTQRRNIDNFVLAAELARSGRLGKLHTVHAHTLDPRTSHDWLPGEPEPARLVVDWDRWLGPCPWRPYHPLYVQGRWRGYFDFHGGGILEWGAHTVDMCQWANDADGTQPVEYDPKGNHVYCRYGNGVRLVMRDDGWLGLGTCHVRFEGDEGWVETADSGKMEMSESLRSLHRVITERGTDPAKHVRDFLNCVKSRSQPRSNAEASCNTHIACHAAYIAWQLGRKLTWDPAKAEFVNDDEANRMRSRAMREPWRI
jgi:predicted dehydrogenase